MKTTHSFNRSVFMLLLLLFVVANVKAQNDSLLTPPATQPDTATKAPPKTSVQIFDSLFNQYMQLKSAGTPVGFLELTSTHLITTYQPKQFYQIDTSHTLKLKHFLFATENKLHNDDTLDRYFIKGKHWKCLRRRKNEYVYYRMDTDSIKDISMVVEDGVISDLKLKGTKYTYRSTAPISILAFDKRVNDKIRAVGNPSVFIKVGDAFTYDDILNQRFIPDNGLHTLSRNKTKDTLRVSSDLNAVLNYAVYTDFLGLIGQESNGLAQFELSTKIPLNTRNIPNTHGFVLRFVEFGGRASKFDSKYAETATDSTGISIDNGDTSITYSYNKVNLYQRSFFAVNIKLNLFSYIRQRMGVCINAGGDYGLSTLKFNNSASTQNISIVNGYLEGTVFAKKSENFGVDVGAKLLYQSHLALKDIDRPDGIWMVAPGFSFFYYPEDKKANCIYLRGVYYKDMNAADSYFYQIQFGYRSTLAFKSDK